MENYKHTPPKTYFDVTWMHVKDWWINELKFEWEDIGAQKYEALKMYNKTHFPNKNKPAKPVRYLNRVETSC